MYQVVDEVDLLLETDGSNRYLCWMRMSKIKLSGFKSFVDSTTIHFPSDLTGVVGPNGCGKSNVIDAVRWVMGESSAKHLRGDSMADVIFNGSNARKPVAQASVELVFEDCEGAISGEYAGFSEIAIRRQVSRDGQSNYFLNGTRCRRRDITDIFLGTGLGPRSYSIIEQGTISRLIEAKPEDLRIFLEEAAGISKYKERRRETENRIRHTKDNLSRLDDLIEEIDKQLEKLKRQARTAVRFKELREQQHRAKAELLTLRYQVLHEESGDKRGQIKELETRLEGLIADLRSVEASLEKGRDEQVEAADNFNEVQGRFYELGAEVARVEQAIQHSKETQDNQQTELKKADQAWNEVLVHISTDTSRLEELAIELAENQPIREQAKTASQASLESREKAEQKMQAWQSDWDEFNTRLNQSSQSAQVERTRIDQIEKQLLQLVQRIEKSTLESSQLDSQQLENDISGFSSQVDGHREQADSLQKSLDTLRARIDELRTTTRTMQEQLHESQNQQQEVRGRLASLQALQQAALGENGGVVNKWLESQGLGEATRLAKQLSVEAGWERAVETVLGFYLEAVCVDNSTELLSELANLTQGSLAIVDSGGQAESNSTNKASPLTDKVSAPWSLDGLLAGVYIADSLQEAMSIRSQLAAHESIVTQDGIWLGNGWLRVARDADQKAGVLEREREIKELSSKVEVITEESKQITTQLETGRSDLQEAEASRDGLQAEVNQAHRKFSDTKAQLESRNSRLDQLRKRKVSLDNELEELVIQQGQDLEIVSTARSVLNTALTSLDSLASDRESRLSQRDELRSALDQLRQEAQRDRDNAHALELKYRSLHTEQETKDQNLSRMKNQQEHLKLRRDELLQALSECETPFKEMQDELAVQLKSRVGVEEELTGKRKRVEDIDHLLREQEQSRHTREQQSQQLREQLGQLKLSWQEIKVRGETILEQVAESGFELATLVEELAEDAVLADWESTVEQVTNRIQKLGPINLAAIEEFDEQSERKNISGCSAFRCN